MNRKGPSVLIQEFNQPCFQRIREEEDWYMFVERITSISGFAERTGNPYYLPDRPENPSASEPI